ncbi:hypothetical protein CYLTODRAFT_439216 [Cylindrobasidium torrendii FP15055 ss-10]|uniref:Matrin-type domain-containing protein n=1 Tax=Cylindrobasidium torrendii FP15055 ss-10 TaxID=1314674 RepID=A0A0D7BXC5_9AGAR|nr:hypothetical protein CYLTODRAFT_439216 [Cylindrobasidium torrendii FP15055 ss-10]
MSEYWVSKQKYFCKYCDIYIADDAPSRQLHENGLRHKGNRDRFIRNLYKEGAQKKKDEAEEKAEMARIDKAAAAAYALDVGSGVAKASSSSAPAKASSSASTSKREKPSNPWANYSTAASLGYTDPDAEKAKVLAMQRQSEGVAGQWQVVETITPPPPPIPQDSANDEVKLETDPDADSALGKRPSEEEENPRHFKLRKRNLDVGLGKIYDPGAITITLKKKDRPPEPEATVKKEEDIADGTSTGVKWTAAKWKTEDDEEEEEEEMPLASELLRREAEEKAKAEAALKKEEEDVQIKQEENKVKLESELEIAAPKPVFKKRRPQASTSRVKREF